MLCMISRVYSISFTSHLEAANVRYDYNCGLLCKLVYVLNVLVFCQTTYSFMSLQTPAIFPNNSTVVYDRYALMTKLVIQGHASQTTLLTI